MTNPTTPFGWQMPTSTDLVTDLPADFEVFGQAVATSMTDLLGGTTGQVLAKASNTDMDFSWVAQDDSNAIQNAIVDAKGDLIGATAADTPARLAVGTNGQVLTADSTAATGLKWATSSSGGMTLLSTTTLSGSSTSISITPTGYNQIQVVVYGVTNGSNSNVFMGINSDNTASNYVQAYYGTVNTAYYSGANVGIAGVNAIVPGVSGWKGSDSSSIAQFTIYQPNLTSRKLVTAASAFIEDSSQNAASNTTCDYVTSSAISSIQIKCTVGSFTAGTVLVYGVK